MGPRRTGRSSCTVSSLVMVISLRDTLASGLPYRLIPGVSALVTESFLKEPDIVLVGTEEVHVVVKLHGVCHVERDKVLIPALRPWEPRLIGLGW